MTNIYWSKAYRFLEGPSEAVAEISNDMEVFEKIVRTKTGTFTVPDESFLHSSMGDRLNAAAITRLANEQMISNVLAIMRLKDIGSYTPGDSAETDEDAVPYQEAALSLVSLLDTYVLQVSQDTTDAD
jgi:hypothetical protein